MATTRRLAGRGGAGEEWGYAVLALGFKELFLFIEYYDVATRQMNLQTRLQARRLAGRRRSTRVNGCVRAAIGYELGGGEGSSTGCKQLHCQWRHLFSVYSWIASRFIK